MNNCPPACMTFILPKSAKESRLFKLETRTENNIFNFYSISDK